MASQAHDAFAPRRSFVADANISRHTAVVLSGFSNGQTHVNVAGAGDVLIGVASRDCASGDFVDVIMPSAGILVQADAGPAAILAGSPLIVEANGLFVLATAGAYAYTALEALASGTGFIEAIALGGELGDPGTDGTMTAGEI